MSPISHIFFRHRNYPRFMDWPTCKIQTWVVVDSDCPNGTLAPSDKITTFARERHGRRGLLCIPNLSIHLPITPLAGLGPESVLGHSGRPDWCERRFCYVILRSGWSR